MAFQKWELLGFVFLVVILSLLLTSCLFSESSSTDWELDVDFNREPFEIGISAYNDSMRFSVFPPPRVCLQYCIRSHCGRTNPLEANSVGGMFALDDTISVLWSNRSGDTLRTLVQIDRDWFTDGFIVVGDTLRIRRPQGTITPFGVSIMGKDGRWRGGDTLWEKEKISEVIAPSPGAWEELGRVQLTKLGAIGSDEYVRDTIAIIPVQYINTLRYTYLDSEVLLQDGFSRDYVTIR